MNEGDPHIKDIERKIDELKKIYDERVIRYPPNRIEIVQFVNDFYLPMIMLIENSSYFSSDEKDKTSEYKRQVATNRDLLESRKREYGEDDDDVKKLTTYLKSIVEKHIRSLVEGMRNVPPETRQDLRQKQQLDTIITEKEDEDESLYTIKVTVDRQVNEFNKLRKLEDGIRRGELDQKYLYWEPSAAERWKRICDRSAYELHKISRRLIEDKIDDILKVIKDSAKSQVFDFVNLGVGGAYKDYIILDQLLKTLPSGNILEYIPIEQSVCMLENSIDYIDELLRVYPNKMKINAILGDFLYIQRYKNFIYTRRNVPKIYGLLGNSIGNFQEDEILDPVLSVMCDKDFLIMGVELIAGRSDEELKSGYSDDLARNFIVYPIIEHLPIADRNAETITQLLRKPLLQRVQHFGNVADSKTVFTSIMLNEKMIRCFYSTKYNLDAMKNYLQNKGFQILLTLLNAENTYSKLVLRRN